MANDETATGTAAYVPWRTFMNTLDALARHMPNRIDRSAFPGQSGAGQNQLLIAFRFLGLIGEDGKPTPDLHAIAVADEVARRAALRKVVEQRYANLFELNLVKATPSEFSEQMGHSYNVSGDTKLKATRFFLAAASYLDIPMSPLLMRDKTKPGNGGALPRRRRSMAPRVREGEPEITPPAPPPAGTARSIQLKSGGTLTVSASLDFLRLNPQDRTFVFDLIDKLDEYEKQNSLTE